MTIQQLRYFLALCEDLNYTRTAGRMYLSRQALRLSIAALEEELCGPLFINVRNHLAPVSYTHLTLPTMITV